MQRSKIRWNTVRFNDSDRKLAERLGVSHTVVRRHRISLGIKSPCKPPRHKRWSKVGIGRMSHAALARREGITRQTVYNEWLRRQ